MSDFIDAGYADALRQMRRRHDLTAISLVDPRERRLPPVGLMTLRDAESGAQVVVDCSNRQVRESYERSQTQAEAHRTSLFRGLAVDEIIIDPTESYVEPLVRFFETRMKRAARI